MAQEDITTQLFADILPKTPAQEQATYQAQRDLMALKMAQLPAGAGVRFAGFQASQDLGRALGGVEKGLRQGLFGIDFLTIKYPKKRINLWYFFKKILVFKNNSRFLKIILSF